MNKKTYIEFISVYPKEMLSRNSKMRKTGRGFYQTSLPALKCLLPKTGVLETFVTCPNADKCSGFCYAAQGAYPFKNTQLDHIRKLYLLVNDPHMFTKKILNELTYKNVTNLRWHDAGDFFSKEYLQLAFDIMKNTPDVQHYTYTKMVSLFESMPKKDIPENFTVVYSYGGKEDNLIQPDIHRHSKVFSSKENMKKAGYSSGIETDLIASDKNIKNVGLVYHGNIKISENVFY